MIKQIFNLITAPFIKYKTYILITIVIFIISSMYGSFKVSNITPEEVLSISEELLYSTFIENPFNDFIFRILDLQYFG